MLIQQGCIYTSAGFAPAHSLRSANRRIVEIGPDETLVLEAGEPVVDATGYRVIPGLIDLHIHGAAGHDAMDATPTALAGMARYLARHGVTAFLATTMTGPHATLLEAIRCVATYVAAQEQAGERPGDGARLLGLNLEGPFLSRGAKGAQPETYCRAPDLAELQDFLAAGPVRLITLAPELPGAEAFVRAAVAQGVRIAVGHTQATYEQVEAAADWGARQGTHTFNAMTGLHHRQPGAVGAILSDKRLVAELIADGIHVHPAVLALAVRAKTPSGVALVSDAIRATGLPDGTYDLGGQAVVVQDGSCWLAADGAGRTLAGSTLTLDHGLRNIMAATGLTLEEALPMATAVPAAALGHAATLGTLAPGAWADVVLLDEANQVVMTIVGGQVVYKRAE